MSDDVVEHARAILARELNLDLNRLAPSHLLREDLGMDSIIALNLIFAAERELNLILSEEDVVRLVTVGDLEQLIRRLSQPALQ
jgi:acyl carrier protein